MNISLKSIILGLNLDEGLIQTYPLDKTADILNRDKEFNQFFRAYIKDDKWIVIEFKPTDFDWNSLEEAHFFEDYVGMHRGNGIKYFLEKLNLFGYIPTYVEILRNNKIKTEYRFSYNRLKNDIDDYNGDLIRLFFQPKYSEIMSSDEVPHFIFHLSELDFRNKIKKIGLVPRRNERYDDRVYVCLCESDMTPQFIKNLKREKSIKAFERYGKQIIVDTLDLYKIDTSDLNLILYKDPEFSENGFYIKKNIPPKNITFIKTV
jgi:hypothetical protein